jgi:rubrerythrin
LLPGGEAVRGSLNELRDEQGVDQTLQNLLRALTLNLELRARYRVFEFEATQDGFPRTAQLFHELRQIESEQIAALMSCLHDRLDDGELGFPPVG